VILVHVVDKEEEVAERRVRRRPFEPPVPLPAPVPDPRLREESEQTSKAGQAVRTWQITIGGTSSRDVMIISGSSSIMTFSARKSWSAGRPRPSRDVLSKSRIRFAL
jgi:hypothetical protein